MQYRVLRGFCLGNGADAFPGQVISLAGGEAAALLRQGRVAELADDADQQEPSAGDTFDAPPAKRGRKKGADHAQ